MKNKILNYPIDIISFYIIFLFFTFFLFINSNYWYSWNTENLSTRLSTKI